MFDAELSEDDLAAPFVPAPAEIEAGCAIVQRNWSEAERKRRVVAPNKRAEIPAQASRGRRKEFFRGHD